MLVLQMQVKRGVAEVDLVTVALVARGLATITRLATLALLNLRVGVLLLRNAHQIVVINRL